MQDPALEEQQRRDRRGRWLVLTAAFLGWMFDGLEQGVFPLVARPALQDLLGVVGDKQIGPWMGYITALFLLGAALGGIVFGWLGDRVGRVRAMILSILAYSLFTGCCYFAQAPWQLGFFRFPIRDRDGRRMGFGSRAGDGMLAGAASTAPVGSNRSRCQHRFWLAGFAGNDVSGHPRFLALGDARRGCPGSLDSLYRFLRAGIREVEEIGPKAGVTPLFVRYSHADSGKRLCSGILFASIALIGTWGSVQWLPAWADQLTDGKSRTAKGLTQMLSALGAVIGCFVGPLIGGRLGRRPAYFLFACRRYSPAASCSAA